METPLAQHVAATAACLLGPDCARALGAALRSDAGAAALGDLARDGTSGLYVTAAAGGSSSLSSGASVGRSAAPPASALAFVDRTAHAHVSPLPPLSHSPRHCRWVGV